MDVPASAAAPWIVLGATLGVLLALAVGAAALRLRSRPGPTAGAQPVPHGHDDLAEFLEHPPGTPGARDDVADGWPSLAPAPAAAPPGESAAGLSAQQVDPRRVIGAFAVATVVLVGVAAALGAAARTPEPADPSGAAPAASLAAPSPGGPADGTNGSGRGDVTARLLFTGVVLEEHAVGITAAYPELELTVEGDDAVARLVLPTANCLAAADPPPPGDPACRAARTEYADLAAPELRVDRDGDRLRVSGTFATYLSHPGGGVERTGRSYDVVVTAGPAGDQGSGEVPADARLQWGQEQAVTRADVRSVLHRGG